jgi:hypothetical protein
MIERHSLAIIVIGLVLVIAGVVFPFLMVIRVLPSTFVLNFLSYTASVSGLLLGILGMAFYFKVRKPNHKDE